MKYFRIFLRRKQVSHAHSRKLSHRSDSITPRPRPFSTQIKSGSASLGLTLRRQGTEDSIYPQDLLSSGLFSPDAMQGPGSYIPTMMSAFETLFLTFQNCSLAWDSRALPSLLGTGILTEPVWNLVTLLYIDILMCCKTRTRSSHCSVPHWGCSRGHWTHSSLSNTAWSVTPQSL